MSHANELDVNSRLFDMHTTEIHYMQASFLVIYMYFEKNNNVFLTVVGMDGTKYLRFWDKIVPSFQNDSNK